MKIFNPQKRLNAFWGKVDDKHVESIAKHIIGTAILDVGCGMGSTTFKLSKLNSTYNVTGIDYSAEDIAIAKSNFKDCTFLEANCENLPFEDQSFDSIILRDALHHLLHESDFNKVKAELKRVLKPNGVIITLDPNITWWLKKMRILMQHEDQECDFETAMQIFENEMHLKVKTVKFHTLFSLPASGGYVGINLIPDWPWLWKLLLGIERILEGLINLFGLGRFLTWRYLIVAEKI